MTLVESVAGNPREEYQRRLKALQAAESLDRQRDKLFVASKIAVCVVIVFAAAWLVRYGRAQLYLTLVPVAVFVLLFVLHERVLKAMRLRARLKALYERGMARLEDRWMGKGQQGERFLDPSHPYARDLDLFGAGSLFELLCTARSSAGEETLAAWLLAPASMAEAAAREAAVEELRTRVDFRERLAIAGEDLRTGGHPAALAAWSEDKTRLDVRLTRVIAPLLTGLWLLSLIGWWIKDWGAAALCVSLLNVALYYRFRAQIMKFAAAIEQATSELGLLAAIFLQIEQESFASEKLRGLQARLKSSGEPPSKALASLSKRVDWLDSHDNWFVKIIAPFVFWSPQWIASIERWRAVHGAAVREWMSVVGEVEALAALSGYAYEHPENVFAEFVEQGPYLDVEGLSHPLIPRERAVANDLKLDTSLQMLVISGPNMAGKSTFIRSVGVNVVLAQAGAPVRARRMRLSRLEVTASICVLDSLQGGLSRFYAEITRLKKIDDLSREAVPVLFLLDELLSGTNSHDRRIGTESFVRSLLGRGAIGLVTTHDLALARIAESMDGRAANFHFEDRFENGKLQFDYRLTPGVVQTTNALSLMRSIGIDV
jgi:DNA mismatch repair ATPase MutS